MVNILLCGHDGKMGKVISCIASDSSDVNIIPFDPCGQNEGADVLLDFSHHSMLDAVLAHAKKNNLPIVVATTGYTEKQEQQIRDASKVVPVFRSGNFSLSVFKFIQAAAAFAKVWDGDIEIVETHHNLKEDAPSGTALMIGNAIIAARGEGKLVFGRSGICKRKAGDIGVNAVRGGAVAGEHEVRFYDQSSEVHMREREYGKNSFAIGAIEACKFMIKRKPGYYQMPDLVNSK
jgi:4-hydroxy-tetrahydrodipicolinate reductase